MKKIFITIMILFIILLGKCLQRLDDMEREQAMQRCNGQIEEYYKGEDTFYKCVEE